MENKQFLPQDGRYDDLIVYQKSGCICDITDYFCKTFMDGRKDRTVDQMVQAARSGKQNIVEGTAASATSKETEIKLLNVAKASHQELLEDYKDYLRHHNLPLWLPGNPHYSRTRRVCKAHNDSAYFMELMPRCNDEMIANLAITIICQVDLLLRNLIEYHKQEFLEHGGIREEMTRGRMAYRNSHTGQPRPPVASNTALSKREQELNDREACIAQKEQELQRREKELEVREKEVARLMRLGMAERNNRE